MLNWPQKGRMLRILRIAPDPLRRPGHTVASCTPEPPPAAFIVARIHYIPSGLMRDGVGERCRELHLRSMIRTSTRSGPTFDAPDIH